MIGLTLKQISILDKPVLTLITTCQRQTSGLSQNISSNTLLNIGHISFYKFFAHRVLYNGQKRFECIHRSYRYCLSFHTLKIMSNEPLAHKLFRELFLILSSILTFLIPSSIKATRRIWSIIPTIKSYLLLIKVIIMFITKPFFSCTIERYTLTFNNLRLVSH
jgi:hypothetical protein